MDVKPFMNIYFLFAQLLNLVSYYQSNFLILRILFLGSATFYCIYAATSDIVIIDFLVFNIIFFFINLSRSITLFKEIIPPNLTNEEADIYNSYLGKYMKKNEMKTLFSIASKQIYKVSCTLVNPGNGFSSIYLIYRIPVNSEVLVTFEGVHKQSNFAWVGILELLDIILDHKNYLNNLIDKNISWSLKLEIKFFKNNTDNYFNFKTSSKSSCHSYNDNNNKSNNSSIICNNSNTFFDNKILNLNSKYETNKTKLDKINSNFSKNQYLDNLLKTEKELIKINKIISNNRKDSRNSYFNLEDKNKNNNFLIIYEFDIFRLFEIFDKDKNGYNIKKSLYSIWLEACSEFVKMKNEANLTYVKTIKRKSNIINFD